MTASTGATPQTVDFRAGPIVIPVSYAQFAIVRPLSFSKSFILL
jgi:hypothetical protein